MKVLFVHPGSLMSCGTSLCLEPLGLELVVGAVRRAGHEARLLDLRLFTHDDYAGQLDGWGPDAVGFSLNYLANVPEVLDLAKQIRCRLPGCFVFAGGHSASFTAPELLAQAAGALDCVVCGEGEVVTPLLLEAVLRKSALEFLPGVVTRKGQGPPPRPRSGVDQASPYRELIRSRRQYFIEELGPCASIDLSKASAERSAADLAAVIEPSVFIVGEAAVHTEHGLATLRALTLGRVKKRYGLETTAEVFLKHQDAFRAWARMGLRVLFLAPAPQAQTLEALAAARALGLKPSVNVLVDPDWDEAAFTRARAWAAVVPAAVRLSINTPTPGAGSWQADLRTLTTQDYRLFDAQHAVLKTRLPLPQFYGEVARLRQAARPALVRMLWSAPAQYDPKRCTSDHERPVAYELRTPRSEFRRPDIEPAGLQVGDDDRGAQR